jgi:phosphohistidine swiveling domain-containing protein
MMLGVELNMISLRRRLALCAACCLCVLGGTLALASAPALAAQKHELLRSFGLLSDPQGLAVDLSSGDVYVADTGEHSVQAFTGEGVFVSSFGTFTTPQFVAVDQATGDVYVADTGDNTVQKFTPSGALVTSWGTGGQLDGSTTTAKTFGVMAGIAVGQSGTLYVLGGETKQSNIVFEFEQSGVFKEELELKDSGREVKPIGLGVDSAGDLFKADGEGAIEEFDSTGHEISQVSIGDGAVVSKARPGANAFAVDLTSGDLYVSDLSGALEHFAFNGSHEVVQSGGGACPVECAPTDEAPIGFAGTGIVLSTGGDVYLSDPVDGKVHELSGLVTVPDVTTGPASDVQPGSMMLSGSVDPEGAALKECVFEYVEAAKFSAGASDPYAAGGTVACEDPDAGEVPVDSSTHDVHAALAGLSPATVYDYRLRAVNAEGGFNEGSNATQETTPLPSIDSATVSGLTAGGAMLKAQIDPHGASTSYRFEYDTREYAQGEGPHGTRVPAGAEPTITGTADVFVSQAIVGLSANTTYYWRVVATSASGTTTSVQHTFVYSTGGEGLPDGRAYEMVTPAHKNGALLGDVTFVGGVPLVSAHGDRLIASVVQCFGGAQSCNAQKGDDVGSPYAFSRTSSGWVTTPLAPPATQFATNAPWGFDATTGDALFSMPTQPFGEDDFYVREAGGEYVDIGPATPREDGPAELNGGKVSGVLQVQTADYSHLVWQLQQATTGGSQWPFDERNPGTTTAYEYAGVGNVQPLLIGVTGGEGSNELISKCGTRVGAGKPGLNLPGMLSEDGRTVFFSALIAVAEGNPPCSSGTGSNAGKEVPANELYARVDGELPDAHTVGISVPSPSECGAGAQADETACRAAAAHPVGANFMGASADGSKAFFLTTQQLTDDGSEDSHSGDDATIAGCQAASDSGCNLYEYDFANQSGHGLVDASAGDVGGAGPRVQGVMALSPDGTHVYFVAKGVLTGAVNDRGQVAQDGADNLYLFERDQAHPSGRIAFVAVLPETDRGEWEEEPGKPVNVTPEGRYIVFLSHGQLTADDTSVSGAEQVFRYDAGTGRLNRVSIGMDGFDDDGNRSSATPCGASECSEDPRIVQALGEERSDPTMSDNGGRVFFMSPVGLTPDALNDVPAETEQSKTAPEYAQNVYEWEQQGIGSCPAGQQAGCVHLITDGRDVSADAGQDALCGFSSVCLLGTDTTGSNVFFSTDDRLTRADTNSEMDFYDARVCEPEQGNPCMSEPPASLPPCLGEACHGTPAGTPPIPADPTATFNGQGNATTEQPAAASAKSTPKSSTRAQKLAAALKACRKDRSKQKRVRCEATARKQYGGVKAKKSSGAAKAGKSDHRRSR